MHNYVSENKLTRCISNGGKELKRSFKQAMTSSLITLHPSAAISSLGRPSSNTYRPP